MEEKGVPRGGKREDPVLSQEDMPLLIQMSSGKVGIISSKPTGQEKVVRVTENLLGEWGTTSY